jgi:hypothetical protein
VRYDCPADIEKLTRISLRRNDLMFWRSKIRDELRLANEKVSGKDAQINKLRKQLENRDRKLAGYEAQLSALSGGDDTAGVRPESIVWIFCTGRSGSTWLGSMMGSIEDHIMWNEPLVGALFGEAYYGWGAHKRGAKFILGPPLKPVWLRSIRNMVLEGSTVRYPEIADGGYLVIKEPHGSIGAPLLMEALPESRMVFLVRDPRDVISSALDGSRKGSWIDQRGRALQTAEEDPDAFVEARANSYQRDMENARQAYESHVGPKASLRYEDLRSNTLDEMRRIFSKLQIAVEDDELARVVEEHSWENIPEENKGEGKFYRKATPGSWREDLTPQQIQTVERITASVLNEFYS